MIDVVTRSLTDAQKALDNLLRDEKTLNTIVEASKKIASSLKAGGKLYTCGNGGSMCDAMHFAEELTGRFRSNRKPIPAQSISDSSHISCVSNDFGYEHVFSRYIEAFAESGDIFFPISTSGKSPNCILGAKAAKEKNAVVISLVGKKNSPLEEQSDLTIVAEGLTNWADRSQELHIKCIHILMELIELQMIDGEKTNG